MATEKTNEESVNFVKFSEKEPDFFLKSIWNFGIIKFDFFVELQKNKRTFLGV